MCVAAMELVNMITSFEEAIEMVLQRWQALADS
jgi:hypothetical protein